MSAALRLALRVALATLLLVRGARGAENFDPASHLSKDLDPNRNTLLVIYDDPDSPEFPKAFRGSRAPKAQREDRSHLYTRLAAAVRTLEEEEKPPSLNISTAILSSKNSWFDLAAEEWKFRRSDLPLALFLVGSKEKGLKYKRMLKEEIAVHEGEEADAPSKRTGHALRQFMRRSLAGQGDVWVRSEPKPEEPPAAGELLQVVGNSFEDEVLRSGRDILVMFGAPWCGFSKRLQAHLQAVSQRVGMDCNVHKSFCIAMLDHSANDHPASSGVGHLETVPHLYLYRGQVSAGKTPEPIHIPRDNHQGPEKLLDYLLEQGVVHKTQFKDEEF